MPPASRQPQSRSQGRSHGRPHRSPARASWLPTALSGTWKGQTDLFVLFGLLVLVALGGGSAFADTLSLIYVRMAAVVALVVFALTPTRPDWRTCRVPLALLAALAAIMVAQLVPLPPSVWTALPGRASYLEAAAAFGRSQPWRPLSLTPDLTVNSLVSLVVPAAVLLGFAKLDAAQRERLVIGFVVLCLASMAIGVTQYAGGERSPLYLYKRTYQGMPVGLLANRNHQAALLAAFFPALRVWSLLPTPDARRVQHRTWLALALGIVAIPVILATGSRAGILLGLASLAATFALFSARGQRHNPAPVSIQARLLRIGIPVLLVGMVLATWRFGRALSIQRLAGQAPAVDEDLRFQFAPYVVGIIKDSFPVGTGFGSFDPMFRRYEPDAALKNSFFNHAHNELLELVMTAGIAGAALLAVFLVWWIARLVRATRERPQTRTTHLTLLGGTIIGIMLAASVVDYPLRTPLLGAWFAIACGWLCAGAPGRHAGRLQAERLP